MPPIALPGWNGQAEDRFAKGYLLPFRVDAIQAARGITGLQSMGLCPIVLRILGAYARERTEVA
jgi:hypothetical protein